MSKKIATKTVKAVKSTTPTAPATDKKPRKPVEHHRAAPVIGHMAKPTYWSDLTIKKVESIESALSKAKVLIAKKSEKAKAKAAKIKPAKVSADVRKLEAYRRKAAKLEAKIAAKALASAV